MPQCAVIAESGALVASAADPCTGLVVLTPAEYASLADNPFHLTPEQGTLIAAAVAGVWVIAWCAKAFVRALNSDGEPTKE